MDLFFVGAQQMPPWWSWYWYLNPISWTLYAIIVTQVMASVPMSLRKHCESSTYICREFAVRFGIEQRMYVVICTLWVT
jgi:hypothetical protein